MNQPNQRGGGGGYRQQQAQQPAPGTIKTKKYQFDTNTYTRIAMGEVWRKDYSVCRGAAASHYLALVVVAAAERGAHCYLCTAALGPNYGRDADGAKQAAV
jgi:hypothetical protein